MKWFLSRLTMKKIVECYFVDCVSGEEVGIWKDRYGAYYMAVNRWGCRVVSKYEEQMCYIDHTNFM